MKNTIIILLSLALTSVICSIPDRDAYIESKYKKENHMLRDSLSKANGLIKKHGFKWPSEQ